MNARDVFFARLNRIVELTASIEEFAGVLAGTHEVNWGHAGSMGHVEQQLTEVHRIMVECLATWR